MVENKIQKQILQNLRKDSKQLSVVKSNNLRLIVEAPAGYGKTYTMVSMIGYWLSSNFTPLHKTVLCLSFSISASNRMKEDISSFYKSNFNKSLDFSKVQTTNFHGYCRSVLKKYGSLIGITNLDSLKIIDSKDPDCKEFHSITQLEQQVKNISITSSQLLNESKINKYIQEQIRLLTEKGKITFDSIIIFTLYLFMKFPYILSGYQKSLFAICIDEFQDTNVLGISLIKILLTPKTKLVIFGDSMQQIFRFQGAIPNLIDKVLENNGTNDNEYNYIKLDTNHRFANNKNMLNMDVALRTFSRNKRDILNLKKVDINVLHGNSQQDQAQKVSDLIDRIAKNDTHATFAVLLNQVTNTGKSFLRFLKSKKDFLNITFKADDQSFIDFQHEVSNLYQHEYSKRTIVFNEIPKFVTEVKKSFNIKNEYTESFFKLLEAFLKKSTQKIPSNLRSEYIISSLQTETLRQSIQDTNNKITVSTIHGAKGLEWDYVIVADFQQNEFPNYFDLKDMGISATDNNIDFKNIDSNEMESVINKLYVAFTRAKKEIYFSYSNQEISNFKQYQHTEISVLSRLPFFKVNII